MFRGEVLQPVGSAGSPAAGHVGVVELRVKAARPLIRHDQIAILRAADPPVQLPIRYRAVVVVLLVAADQPVSVRHLRRDDRERLHGAVRQDLRVLARHYSFSFYPVYVLQRVASSSAFSTLTNSSWDFSSLEEPLEKLAIE